MPQVQPMNWLYLFFMTNFVCFLVTAGFYFLFSLASISFELEDSYNSKSLRLLW